MAFPKHCATLLTACMLAVHPPTAAGSEQVLYENSFDTQLPIDKPWGTATPSDGTSLEVTREVVEAVGVAGTRALQCAFDSSGWGESYQLSMGFNAPFTGGPATSSAAGVYQVSFTARVLGLLGDQGTIPVSLHFRNVAGDKNVISFHKTFTVHGEFETYSTSLDEWSMEKGAPEEMAPAQYGGIGLVFRTATALDEFGTDSDNALIIDDIKVTQTSQPAAR